MRKMILVLALLVTVSGAALAADSNPPLLYEKIGAAKFGDMTSAIAACEPPPPMCPPPPSCEVASFSNIATMKVKQVPVRTVIEEVKLVTVKKRIVEEECYIATEKRTEIINEVRTRTAQRTIQVPSTKMVSTAPIIKVADPGYGTAPRLARGVSRQVVPTMERVKEEYTETYLQPVRNTYEVAVPKTRRVTRHVEELQPVTVRKTVTTMETQLVSR